MRRVWWPLASVQYSLESHSIPRAQTRKSRLPQQGRRRRSTWPHWATGRSHPRPKAIAASRPESASQLSLAPTTTSHVALDDLKDPRKRCPPREQARCKASSCPRISRESYFPLRAAQKRMSRPAWTLSPSYQITYAPIPPVLQVGSLPKNDVDVGTGLVGAPAYVFRESVVSPSSLCLPLCVSLGAAML